MDKNKRTNERGRGTLTNAATVLLINDFRPSLSTRTQERKDERRKTIHLPTTATHTTLLHRALLRRWLTLAQSPAERALSEGTPIAKFHPLPLCDAGGQATETETETGQSERRAVRGGDRGRASTPQGAGEGGARCECAVGRCLGRTGRGHWGVSGRRAASLGQAERKFHCDRKGKGPARRIWRASSLGALSPTPGPRARLGNAQDEKTAPTTMCIFKI